MTEFRLGRHQPSTGILAIASLAPINANQAESPAQGMTCAFADDAGDIESPGHGR